MCGHLSPHIQISSILPKNIFLFPGCMTNPEKVTEALEAAWGYLNREFWGPGYPGGWGLKTEMWASGGDVSLPHGLLALWGLAQLGRVGMGTPKAWHPTQEFLSPKSRAVWRERMKFGFRCVTVEELGRIPCGAVLQNFRNVGVKFDQRPADSRKLERHWTKDVKLSGFPTLADRW